MLRIAVPSKGELEEPTLAFLRACGLSVNRPNSRQYMAEIPGLDRSVVVFQRAADIPAKVEEGSVDLGITGLDIVNEGLREGSQVGVLMEDLDYGGCELVVAVPDTWIDVASMADLVEVAEEMRSRGQELRVATKYPRMARDFLLRKELNYFTLVSASGAIEASPTLGFADVIADLTSSGTTLRENGLKTLVDGTILSSQSCLIGNLTSLRNNPEALESTRHLLEMIEAYLRARDFFSVSANVRGDSEDMVAQKALSYPETAGISGPTVAPVHNRYGEERDWFNVTVIVTKKNLMRATERLRGIGANSIIVFPVHYVFHEESSAFVRLEQTLQSTPSLSGRA